MTTAAQDHHEDAPVAEGAPSIESEAPETHEGTEVAETSAKKAISLRVPLEDLALAKELAAELGLGYQTLLNQLISDGLKSTREDLKFRKLVERIKGQLPELKVAEELAHSPAVKAAQELLNSPAVKGAQELLASPAVKAAQEIANSEAIAKVREFGQARATKAAQELADSPLGKLLKEFTETPGFKAAQELANTTSQKLAREWVNSPGGRLARELVSSAVEGTQKLAGDTKSEELSKLSQAVSEMQAALKKANLL